MSALTEFLFPAPAARRPSAIFRWWERRRLGYNLMVGGAGLLSLSIGNVLFVLPPGAPGPMLDWRPIVAFGVLANVCYGLGAVVEMTVDQLWGRAVLPIGPALYRMGLTFSVGLALLPILLGAIGWLVRIVDWLV